MAPESGRFNMKVFAFALLVVLAMQAVHGNEVATGRVRLRAVPLPSYFPPFLLALCSRTSACFRHSLLTIQVFPTADHPDGLHQGRALLQQSNTCPSDVGTMCPPGRWWYCRSGRASGSGGTGGCRSTSQGRFPRVDCTRQCLTT